MEHEATVVLEKDYLHKPRNPKPDQKNELPWTPEQDDTPRRDDTPAAGDDVPSGNSAARREDPLEKPGWFDRA